jgi:hypothetical protein
VNTFYALSATVIVVALATLFLTIPILSTQTSVVSHDEEAASTATQVQPQTDVDKAWAEVQRTEKAWLETDPNLEKDIVAEMKYRPETTAWTTKRNVLLPIVAFFLFAAFIVGKVRYDAPDPE